MATSNKQPSAHTNDLKVLHNEEVETAVLSAITQYPVNFNVARESINTDAFYEIKHQQIFDCMKRIVEAGEEISNVRIVEEALKVYPELTPYEISVTTSHYQGSDITPHLRELKAMRDKRELLAIGNELMKESQEFVQDPTSIIAKARKAIDSIEASNSKHIYSLQDAIGNVTQIMVDNQSQHTMHRGTHTGFDWFDSKGGFQPTDLIIVAAESSQGKTSFALSVINNAIMSGAKIAFYSMEMTKEQLSARLLAMNSDVPSGDILNKMLDEQELQRVNGVAFDLSFNHGKNIYFDDRSTSNLDNILASIRTLKMKYNIEGVVVDYLQILRPEKGVNKEQFIGEAARKLKDIAKELGIWVMALSQLSRDRDTPVPNVNRLRDSGQINEAADLTLLIYRPEAVVPYNPDRKFPAPFEDKSIQGSAMVTIAKGRNVGIGSFVCGFHAPTTHFFQTEIPSAMSMQMRGQTVDYAF